MQNVLESLYTFLDTIANFFDMIHDSFVSAGEYLTTGFDTFQGFFTGIPVLGVLAALVLALGIVLFILGR